MSESSAPSTPAQSAPAESASPADSSQEVGQNQGQSASPSEGDIQEAVESGEISEAEANKLRKKYKLKVRGQEKEVEVDLSDDNYIRNQLQLAEMSKTSMQETAELKKLYQQELQRWKEDPWAVLQELGLDPDEVAASRLEARVKEMQKSPEQVEKERYQAELAAAKEEARKLKERAEQLEMSQLQEQASIQLQRELDEAFANHKTLPKTDYVKRKIFDALHWAASNGYPDTAVADVIPLVEKELKAEFDQFYENTPDELLEKFIGTKTVERMRKRRLQKAKPNVDTASQVKPTTASINKPKESVKPESKVSSKDFFRTLGKGK